MPDNIETYDALMPDGQIKKIQFSIQIKNPKQQYLVAYERNKITAHVHFLNELGERQEIESSFFPTHNDMPELSANILQKRKIFNIESIDKGCIVDGQDFLARTLKQLLALKPEMDGILLANVNHYDTLQILKRAKHGEPVPLLENEPPGPLISALNKIGSQCIEVETQGAGCFCLYGSVTAKQPTAELSCH